MGIHIRLISVCCIGLHGRQPVKRVNLHLGLCLVQTARMHLDITLQRLLGATHHSVCPVLVGLHQLVQTCCNGTSVISGSILVNIQIILKHPRLVARHGIFIGIHLGIGLRSFVSVIPHKTDNQQDDSAYHHHDITFLSGLLVVIRYRTVTTCRTTIATCRYRTHGGHRLLGFRLIGDYGLRGGVSRSTIRLGLHCRRGFCRSGVQRIMTVRTNFLIFKNNSPTLGTSHHLSGDLNSTTRTCGGLVTDLMATFRTFDNCHNCFDMFLSVSLFIHKKDCIPILSYRCRYLISRNP